jgi:hypothetical protein
MNIKSKSTFRTRLAAGGAVASAGILALGLVVVTPDFNGARTEVRQVQLTAVALPSPAQWRALGEFLRDQGQTILPTTKGGVGGAADVPGAVVNAPTAGGTTVFTLDSTNDPALSAQTLQAAALVEPTAAVSLLDPILGIVSPFLALLNPGVLLLFGPIILLVILACPPCAIFNFVTGLLGSFLVDLAPVAAVAAAPVATLEAKVAETTSTDEPLLKDVSLADDPAGRSANALPSPNSQKPDVLPTEPAVQESTEKTTSAEDVTETVRHYEVSTVTNAAEPSASDHASAPVKPKARPQTPRPVVRDSLGSDEQRSGLDHRGNASVKTESSSAASSSTHSSATETKSSGDDSSGGDTSGSD